MAKGPENPADACPYVLGDDGLQRWSGAYAAAWLGLLEAHKRLTRDLEAELVAEYGLSISGLELLGRLAAAEERVLQLSVLAAQTGLSLSRVSRIVDMLEARGLVERRKCPGDARARNAWLTDAGLELLRAAQATHFAGVEKRFFDRLDPDDVAALAAAFERLAPGVATDERSRVP